MTYFLKDNRTGDAAIYKTEVNILREGQYLTFSFVAEHSKFNSFTNQYNGEIYRGDACEVFLSTGVDQHYYEIEVAPNGALFFADITNDGKSTKIKFLENNAIMAKSECLDDKYIVSLKIDLKALNAINAPLKFNALRIETDGEVSDKHLFALNPTLCGSFHKPEFFLILK